MHFISPSAEILVIGLSSVISTLHGKDVHLLSAPDQVSREIDQHSILRMQNADARQFLD